ASTKRMRRTKFERRSGLKMKARVIKNILGVFAFDEKGNLIAKELFSGKPEEIAEKLASDAEKKFVERLGYEAIFEEVDIDTIMRAIGYSREKYDALLHETALAIARKKLGEVSQEKDREVMQAIEALDDLDEALNLLSERLREWYYLHFPEMVAEDQKKFAELLRTGEGIISDFARHAYDLYKFREKLERYVTSAVEEIAPNTAGLVGATLAARLISLAGGVQNLARMPGSRIQVLGAEKALFKHIKSHAPPPKHGIIFQHPAIKTSPWWHRGKIARSLASKIAIAARVDAFAGESMGGRLKEELSKRVEEIKQNYPREPKKMRIIRYKPERKRRKR
ncbi:MAG: C/D box methylation guide ribonucleoprotein complex aNOP56 subunit, partial [Candidatus Hydrothermarchaeota archaeon]|nr:C/D box methylation guide ribonucleoprotein complex aNOP56 subunit [Candidatus Hydrothermarchaeota archaeon]